MSTPGTATPHASWRDRAAALFLRAPWTWATDGILVAALSVVVLWTRFRDESHTLYTVDSVLFALGVRDYDLWSLQPHPPGYPVFVALAKIGTAVRGEENAGIVLVSVAFSVLTVWALYALMRRFVPATIAFVATFLFSVTRSFYFNGVIALSYTTEAACMVAAAYLAHRHLVSASRTNAVLLAIVAAASAGIRQSLGLFLAPLVAVALLYPWRGRQTMDMAVRAAAAGLLTGLTWFIPMVAATGDLSEVRRAGALQADVVVFADAVWRRGWVAFSEHAARLAYFLGPETRFLLPLVAFFLVVLVTAWLLRPALRPRFGAHRTDALFFAAWLLPALGFYLFVFDGWERVPIGYVLTVLPGLYVLGAILAHQAFLILSQVRGHGRRGVLLAAALSVALLIPAAPLAADTHAFVVKEVVAHDDWRYEWEKIRGPLPPNETVILTWYSWTHVKWYFPDYVSYAYFPIIVEQAQNATPSQVTGSQNWELFIEMKDRRDERPFWEMYTAGPGQPKHVIPAGMKRVVVFDVQLAGENGSPRKLDSAVNVTETDADGWRVLVFDVDPARPNIEDYFPSSRNSGQPG